MKQRSVNGARTLPVGTALVETVVLIALTAVLSGTIITGMAALFRAHHSLNAHRVGQSTLQQLATTLRADIHRAKSCQWNAGSQTLEMQMPEQTTVEYLTLQHRWVRVFTSEDEPPVMTSYGVDEAFRGECQGDRLNRGEMIRLRLINQPLDQPPELGSTKRALQCEIVAVVGRDSTLLGE